MPNAILSTGLSRTTASVVAVCLLTLTGCPQQSAQPPGPVAPAKPPAVEKFEHIVADLERVIVSSDPWANRDRGAQGGGSTEFSYKLTHNLIPPGEDTDLYRGAVTITKSYKIVAYPRRDRSSKENDSGASDDPMQPDFEASSDPYGYDAEEPTGGGDSPEMAIPPITTLENEDVKTYNLEYRNDAWELITETNEETESAIREAFDYAIRRQ